MEDKEVHLQEDMPNQPNSPKNNAEQNPNAIEQQDSLYTSATSEMPA